MNKEKKLAQISSEIKLPEHAWHKCFSLARELMTDGCNDGYILIANRRLEEGNLYRVKEALLNAGIAKDTETFKDYIIRCAQQVLNLLREDKVVYIESRSQWDMFDKMDKANNNGKVELSSQPLEVIEILSSSGVDITQEDYKLLAKAAEAKYFANLHSSCTALSDKDYREKVLKDIRKLEELAGLPRGRATGLPFRSKRDLAEEAAYRSVSSGFGT